MLDISESHASLTGALFFGNNAEFGQNGILGQAPRLHQVTSIAVDQAAALLPHPVNW
jgi:hypothetical protein